METGGEKPKRKEDRPRPSVPMLRKRKINWRLVLSKIKRVALAMFKIGVIGLAYVAVVATGLGLMWPEVWSMKLSREPWLAGMENYEGFHALTRAHVAAVALMAVIFWLWPQVLRIYLDSDSGHLFDNHDLYKRAMVVFAVVALVGDAAILYASLTYIGFNRVAFSPAALICVLVYTTVLLGLSLWSCKLKKEEELLLEKERDE